MDETSAVRVAIVDDSDTILKMAQEYLTEAGYEVRGYSNGFQALANIADFHPEVIFVDIDMPILDGYETIVLLRDCPDFRDTPIVVLSSKSGVFNVARGRMLGCTDYVVKPFTRHLLLNSIVKHVPRARSAA